MCDDGSVEVKNSDDYLDTENDAKSKGNKWCCDKSSCHASTSRGVSHSSGDCDVTDSSCASTPQVTRPCTIADSFALAHKSKWKTFKKYIITRLKVKKKRAKSLKRDVLVKPN